MSVRRSHAVRRVLPAVLAVALLAALAGWAPTGTASAAEQPQPDPAFELTGDRIDESSGLAYGGEVLFTVNDSGDGPFVYAVDKESGQTVAVTTYSDHGVRDVEALAGDASRLWVGDIGDNQRAREDVAVYRLRPAVTADRTVQAERFSLAYPDGAHDAETLLEYPTTGRLYVVTKSPLGGTVYAAPGRLSPDGTNRLREIADVPLILATGGVFLPDGEHVVLRNYSGAAVYSFPDFERVERVPLPKQRQGEAVTVDDTGHLYVSSEGGHAPVYRLPLPSSVRATPTPSPSLTPSPSPSVATPPADEADGGRRTPPGVDLGRPRWLVVAILVVALGGFGYRMVRVVRRRGRRRR